jgi:hypothetical protein
VQTAKSLHLPVPLVVVKKALDHQRRNQVAHIVQLLRKHVINGLRLVE